MRDPTSNFSFTNYLHQQGRLSAYINREESIPTRREWSAYLAWAAKRMADVVSYGQQVINIEAVDASGNPLPNGVSPTTEHPIVLVKITSRCSESEKLQIRFAKNLTIGVGGQPRVPEVLLPLYPSDPWKTSIENPERVIHSGTFLPSLAALSPTLHSIVASNSVQASRAPSPTNLQTSISSLPTAVGSASKPLRLAVVGSGQSSAEMCLHLHKTFPSAKVILFFRASALVPSDDSAFVNSVAFDPERTDTFWKAGAQERSDWLKEFKRTNYSVVRTDVLNALNEIIYDQGIDLDAPYPGAAGPSEGSIEIRGNTEVESFEEIGKGGDRPQISLSLRSNKDPNLPIEQLEFDAIFMGTGFERRPSHLRFLSPLAPYFPALSETVIPTSDSAIAASEKIQEEAPHPDGHPKAQQGNESMPEEQDELIQERWRERTRGIARDYTLVSYLSDSFTKAKEPSPLLLLEENELLNESRRPSVVSGSSSRSSSRTLDGASSPNLSPKSNARNLLSSPSHRVKDSCPFEPSVYVFGGNEATHGLSDSLLSICAWRAGEVSRGLSHKVTSKNGSHSHSSVASNAQQLLNTPTSPVKKLQNAMATTVEKLSLV